MTIKSIHSFQVKNISVFRGERLILKKISLSLSSGRSLIIKGPNGAGKSTLLRVLAGLRSVDAGEITWNNENIANNFIEHSQHIAWLSHQDSLKSALTVQENLKLISNLYKTDMHTALKMVNMNPMKNIPVRMLSAGQKRRTALARLLLKPARLWLLDEPSVGLDQETIAKLGHIFTQFTDKGGMIIATTHIPLPLESSETLHLSSSARVAQFF